jgi:serine/threonine-protein kinase
VIRGDLEGRLVAGTFRVISRLAAGGMGTIYRALDVRLDRPVALKVIRPELVASVESAERFELEARVMASVQHPNLAVVYAYGCDQGLHYMALELVEGRALHEVIEARGHVGSARAAEIAAQVLDGLSAIHERGIVHRDVKPPNVMVATQAGRDRVKLVDFGLAKLRGVAGPTEPNVLLGTPTYMSPEQARGEAVDARSDLYAVATVLYEMLVGAPPFESEKIHEVLEGHARRAPPPPGARRPGIPPALEAIVLRGLAKDPARRFPNAAAFAAALRALALPDEPEGALLLPGGVAPTAALSTRVLPRDRRPAGRAPGPQ